MDAMSSWMPSTALREKVAPPIRKLIKIPNARVKVYCSCPAEKASDQDGYLGLRREMIPYAVRAETMALAGEAHKF
ncbi:hypothetical protein P775_12035 [Puniceibacterium antarcticum]|uniref:Uncharacterized protein n=1 Tax=Puniceibacterium antarcticum TaxID=1206336 RepID=A0A2G8REK0_9RHOB|nr:hypothetical protein P775_12035 [Puniceibacterium antarcticum]